MPITRLLQQGTLDPGRRHVLELAEDDRSSQGRRYQCGGALRDNNPGNRFTVCGQRGRRNFSKSSNEPSPFMNVELNQPFVSHLQQEGLASFLIHDVGAFHDFVDFEWLFAERAQDIFAIVQHDQSYCNQARQITENTKADLP